ncbi:hypothetical protein AAFF_G00415100 [Aldrovandia affinis]|uniref:FHA domain-containing protein n=1 Tax=Aldrovandia affinis TaxID=143900 RepID=A0AAD7WJA8_9TELE|nr:hypothetical protein AAFF_G00415100 [Aldrovandia affinis]
MEAMEQERQRENQRDLQRKSVAETVRQQMCEQELMKKHQKLDMERQVKEWQKIREQYEKDMKMQRQKQHDKKMNTRNDYTEQIMTRNAMRAKEGKENEMEERRRRQHVMEKDNWTAMVRDIEADRQDGLQRRKDIVMDKLASKMEEDSLKNKLQTANALARALGQQEAKWLQVQKANNENRKATIEAIAAHREYKRRQHEQTTMEEKQRGWSTLQARIEEEKFYWENEQQIARKKREDLHRLNDIRFMQISEKQAKLKVEKQEQLEFDSRNAQLIREEDAQFQAYTAAIISAASAAEKNTFPLHAAARMGMGCGPDRIIGCKGGSDQPLKMSVTSWFLVSSSGTRHRLPREMIFVGREDCELMLQSRSVDKQHAVINYDPSTDEHLVKDLGSLNGTFVNDLRIPDQTYITLKLSDFLHSHVYVLERSQHKVPEEALKHEKYTSQLQIGLKPLEGKRRDHSDEKGGGGDAPRSKLEKVERKAPSEAPVSRPTPLYGQPSWWGEDDAGNKGQPRESLAENLKDGSPEMEVHLSDRDAQSKSIYAYRREPSYFEIPTKEFQLHPKSPEAEVHEIPTKDTDTPAPPTPTPAPPAPTTPTAPVVQSHASFTIEFDDCTPGKIKIKDHVTKFSFRQRKLPGKELVTTPTEMMSAESKVADWLAHSDVSIMRKKAPCEDVYSTKSDLPVHIKTLKGHQHEDGTQSDSEDPILTEQQSESQPSEERLSPPLVSQKSPSPQAPEEPVPRSPPQAPSPPQSQSKPDPQQAFIIEFFDDNPRKKRSHSFTQNSAHADSYSALKAKLEKRKSAALSGDKGPASAGHIPPTQQMTLPLKGQGTGTPLRPSSLKREKTDDRLCTGTPSSYRSTPAITIRPFSSVGKKSKLAQDFAAEFLRDCKRGVVPTREKTATPAVMEVPFHTHPRAPACSPPLASTPTQPASPAHPPVPLMAPLLPLGIRSVELKASNATKTEEEDSLSDAGTYTIETESQDKEVEDARSMIDQVFGVLESPEYTSVTTAAADRPVINDDRDVQASLRISKGSSLDLKAAPVQGYSPATLSGAPTSPAQVRPVGPMPLGGPKWVSRWASLADGYADPGPAVGLLDIPPQQEMSNRDGGIIHQAMMNRILDSPESEGSQGSRTRRLLPQVPPTDKTECPTPTILIRHDPYVGYEAPEKASGTPRQQETVQRLSVRDDLDPDSLSDASKSDDGSIVDRFRRHRSGRGENCGVQSRAEERGGPAAKSTSFYIGSDEAPSKSPLANSPVLSEAEREQGVPPKTSRQLF